jgi:hypothetical protein
MNILKGRTYKKRSYGFLMRILFIAESYEAAYLYGWMLIEAFLVQIWREHVQIITECFGIYKIGTRSNNSKLCNNRSACV